MHLNQFSILISLLLALSFLISCSTIKYIPIESTSVIKEIDTVIVVVPSKDTCTVIMPAIDTTSIVETSLATSKATITGGTLVHTIANKDSIKVKTVYKTVVEKVEVPIEVPIETQVVPKWC